MIARGIPSENFYLLPMEELNRCAVVFANPFLPRITYSLSLGVRTLFGWCATLSDFFATFWGVGVRLFNPRLTSNIHLTALSKVIRTCFGLGWIYKKESSMSSSPSRNVMKNRPQDLGEYSSWVLAPTRQEALTGKSKLSQKGISPRGRGNEALLGQTNPSSLKRSPNRSAHIVIQWVNQVRSVWIEEKEQWWLSIRMVDTLLACWLAEEEVTVKPASASNLKS